MTTCPSSSHTKPEPVPRGTSTALSESGDSRRSTDVWMFATDGEQRWNSATTPASLSVSPAAAPPPPPPAASPRATDSRSRSTSSRFSMQSRKSTPRSVSSRFSSPDDRSPSAPSVAAVATARGAPPPRSVHAASPPRAPPRAHGRAHASRAALPN